MPDHKGVRSHRHLVYRFMLRIQDDGVGHLSDDVLNILSWGRGRRIFPVLTLTLQLLQMIAQEHKEVMAPCHEILPVHAD